MIPVLSAVQIREADAYTITHEPVASLDLMERAAAACSDFILDRFGNQRPFVVFCGTGNNGGDGLAITRMLKLAGCKVRVFVVCYNDKSNEDFKTNISRLVDPDDELKTIKTIHTRDQLPIIEPNEIVIDAIFGTGLSRAPEGIAAETIQHINSYSGLTIAIDLPSGLFADQSSVGHKDKTINAGITLSFQLPKLAFFVPENAKHTGEIKLLNIGLDKNFIASCKTRYHVVETADLVKMILPRKAFSHKGTYGHALLVAGSYGKTGAAILSARACLRAGTGLLTVQAPRSSHTVLQTSVPEAMLAQEESEEYLQSPADAGKYQVIGIGPGIGTHEDTARMIKLLLQSYAMPMVFDADALNILAENKTWLSFLPANSILTPHPKEFERLFGKTSDDFERMELLRTSAIKHGVYIVLKGRYSMTASPGGNIYINTTGNPGMATGGSGDVLTGILTGLLAQGLTPLDVCLAGVCLHGLAGDLALTEQSEQSLIASDLIHNLGAAFKEVEKLRSW